MKNPASGAFGGSRTDASAGVPFGMLNQLSRYTASGGRFSSTDLVSVLGGIVFGGYSIPEITLSGIAVSTTDNKVFAIAETEINQTVGTTNYVGTLGGNVDNGKLTLNYALKPGAMPMSITFIFVGE